MDAGKRLLIVDDDKGTREFYRVLFEEAGYDVVALDSPIKTFSTCARFKPDLLLLDWDMPAGGGKQAYSVAVATLGRKIPVIFASGYPERITIPAGPDTVILKKPANMDTLLAEAGRLLGGG